MPSAHAGDQAAAVAGGLISQISEQACSVEFQRNQFSRGPPPDCLPDCLPDLRASVQATSHRRKQADCNVEPGRRLVCAATWLAKRAGQRVSLDAVLSAHPCPCPEAAAGWCVPADRPRRPHKARWPPKASGWV